MVKCGSARAVLRETHVCHVEKLVENSSQISVRYRFQKTVSQFSTNSYCEG